VKTVEQLSEPGKSDYDIYDDILALQQSEEYNKVSEDTNLEYILTRTSTAKKIPH